MLKTILLNSTRPASTIIKKYLSSNSNDFYDIIIVGGGLVGTTLACSLGSNKALQEKKVLLLENTRGTKQFTGGDYSNRVSAINDAAVELLKSINAWNAISSARYKPVKQMHVWEGSSNASITFNHDGFTKDIAYVVENNLIVQAVLEQLERVHNVKIKYSSKVVDIQLPSNSAKGSSVTLKSGETLSCDLLIGADGFNSTVRKKMDINFYTTNYKQCALVATVEHDEAGDNSVAWQKFMPNGPIALLPLNDTQSSLVWTTTPLEAKRLATIPAEEFIDELNGALIGADGFNSTVRKKMDINFYTTNYKQCALVATVEHDEAGDNSVAWQKFMPNGPIALLPLNDTQSSLVWTTTPLEAKRLATIPAEEFIDELNGALFKDCAQSMFVKNAVATVDALFGTTQKSVKQYPKSIKKIDIKSRAFFPLGLSHASSYVKHGVVLIGDAGHRIHPLAGQGANLGFCDIICLTEVLSEAARSGFRLGHIHQLIQYERERLKKNSAMLFGVHFLQKIYDTQSVPIVSLRSVGLQTTQNLKILKKFFMEQSTR